MSKATIETASIKTAPVKTAMVLAAGLGTRMRPLTDDRPKALVEVDGRALVDHMLDRLAEDGVERAVVNVHHFADRLEAHLKSRKAPKIEISDEREALLETGGALAKARERLGADPIYVCNIDSIWLDSVVAKPALAALRAAWDGEAMDACLLLAPITQSLGFDGRGDFNMDSVGRLKWREPSRMTPFAYTGVQIMNPRLFADAPQGRYSLRAFWDDAFAAGRLFGRRLDGYWMHVGDPDARAAAEARLRALRP